ncbi:MAG: peptide ABC transporter substrate-binding protein [Deltaproteobacteria bacterium]|nr:peptide ABC transporter substrate-binding protein [Deltaproteobacteria bacterium]
MKQHSFGLFAFALALTVTAGLCSTASRAAETRVSVGVTETMETFNPYGDSVALMYGVWCQVLGCLGTYDFDKGQYVGTIAERWEVKDPNNWIFHVRKGVKFHNGTRVTAHDIVHSIGRARKDPLSKQTIIVAAVASEKALDDYTVQLTTKIPTAPLLDYLFDLLIITSKDLYDKYGPEVADRQYPIGAGPYKFRELIPGQRLVIGKDKTHPMWKQYPQAPDEIVFRIMREPEQRVTALLSNEIQIAQFVPPHMRERVENSPNHRIVKLLANELMFLAMMNKVKPWDNKLVRQAVAYAIDRDTIIKTLLRGEASRLDGPLGEGQYGYDPNLQPKYTYNPEKAKELLKQAGYPNGVDVELQTPVGRYTLDKQLTEAMIPMLNAAGFRAKLLTPDWATLWANVQVGKVPFYYMGRGSVLDPSLALAQYFETGASPRIGYSNPKVDELLQQERQTFDPAKRKKILAQAMSLITEDAPAHFLWRHQLFFGMAKNVEYRPLPNERIYGWNIKVK